MEEILELKELIKSHDYNGALKIVEELEEMSRGDIVRVIKSHATILLIHLIKQKVESKTTNFWDISIQNSVEEIQDENLRPKIGIYYLSSGELHDILVKVYDQAIRQASLEVKGGIYKPKELDIIVDKTERINYALTLVMK